MKKKLPSKHFGWHWRKLGWILLLIMPAILSASIFPGSVPAINSQNKKKQVFVKPAIKAKAIVITPDASGIIYVNQNAAGDFSGSSWPNAAKELADALVAARNLNLVAPGTVKEVWVAGGTYKPLYSPADNNFGNPDGRNNSFFLLKDVKLFGSFAGTESALAQRDLSNMAHKTILSGDINGDDVVSGSGDNLSITNSGENAYHVLTYLNAASTAVMDGFHVTGGNANGSAQIYVTRIQLFQNLGGGLYYSSGANGIALSNIVFYGNSASSTGGAIHCVGRLTSDKILFKNNLAASGGAFYNKATVNIFTNCKFIGNNALGGNGGAIGSLVGTQYMQNCTFAGNSANYGGALGVETAYAIGSIFTGNTGTVEGGAVYLSMRFEQKDITSTFINCGFNNNESPLGAAVSWSQSLVRSYRYKVDFINSIIRDDVNLGIQRLGNFQFCMLRQPGAKPSNFTFDAATTAMLNQDPAFTDADGADNVAGTEDDDLSLKPLSPASNAGNTALYQNANWPSTDLAGKNRIMESSIDLGAYETQKQPKLIIPDANGIAYVKQNGTGNMNGSSWANATPEVADALYAAKYQNAVAPGTIKEIWVAGGLYKPLYGPTDNTAGIPSGRNNSFLLVKDVKLYGGFAGTEATLAERNLSILANKSTLTGDFSDDDVLSGTGKNLSIANNGENAYNVIISVDDAGTGIIDGFTVTGGNANLNTKIAINAKEVNLSYGSGLYLLKGAPKIRNMNFQANQAELGGAIYNFGSNTEMYNVLFKNNLASGGGAYLNETGDILFTRCNFIGNSAKNSSGGAILARVGDQTINNCKFIGNNAADVGGAIISTKVSVTNSIFSGNSSAGKGGVAYLSGVFVNGERLSNFINCSFTNNQASTGSFLAGSSSFGGLFEFDYQINVVNSIAFNNGNNLFDLSPKQRVSFKNAILQYTAPLAANATLDDVSTNLQNQDPTFTDADGVDNTAGTEDDDLTLQPGSLAVNAGDNTLYQNSNSDSKDLNENARIEETTIDLGAYEFKKQTQSITANDQDKTYGEAPFIPIASASSGLAISYASSDNTIAEAFQDVADGNKWKIEIKKAGIVNVTASQSGNAAYLLATDVIFKLSINKKSVNVDLKPDAVLTKIYDGNTKGSIQNTDLTLANGDLINSDDVQLALSSNEIEYDSKDVGTDKTATLSISNIQLAGAHANNYKIANNSDLISSRAIIKKAALTISANDFSKAYDGMAFTGGNGASYNGFAIGDDATVLTGTLTYGGTSQGANNVGNYAITPGGLSSANYNINYVDGKLLISQSTTNTLSFYTQSAGGVVAKTYGDAGLDASVKATSGLNATYQSSNTAVATVDVNGQVSLLGAGTAIITANEAGNANYAAAAPVSFEVQVAQKALTVSANDFNKTYDGIAYTGGNGVSYNGFANGEDAQVLSGIISYGGTSQGASDVGNYAITPGGLSSANYNISYIDGKLLISQNTANTLAFNTQSAGSVVTKTYGDAGIDASAKSSSGLNATYQSSNTAVATVNVNGQVSLIGAGTATITANEAGNANYAAAAPVSFQVQVDQKALTVSANDFNKTYDGIAYTGGNGVSYNGFANGEDAQVLKGIVSYEGTSQGASDVGNYAITPGGLSSVNYNINYVDGKLLISQNTANTLAFNTQSAGSVVTKTYGDAGIDASAKSSSGLNATYQSSNTAVATVDVNGQVSLIGAGTATITANEAGNANYAAAAPVSFQVQVDQKALTVSANDFNKTYDGIAYTGGNGVSYNGFANGEDANVLRGMLSYGGNSQGASVVGNYAITPGGLSSANYNINYVDGKLLISQNTTNTLAFNTQTAGGVVAKTYGDAGLDASVKATSGLNATYQSSNTAVAIVDVNGQVSLLSAGTAIITANEAGNANYAAAAPVSFQVQVDQKALTVSANDFNKTYDGIAYTGGNGVSYNGFANGEDAQVLKGIVSYEGTSQGASDVGNYAITPGGLSSANYNINYVDGKLLISQNTANTLAFNTQSAGSVVTKTYGDAGIDASAKSSSGLNATYQSSNTAVATVDVNGQVSLIGAGTATITANEAGNANYAAAAPVSFQVQVDQKALTISANDFNKIYDGIAYTGGNGVSYNGFANGEDAQVLKGIVSYEGTSQGASDVGNYAITPGGLSSANYNINYVDGKLLISQNTANTLAFNTQSAGSVVTKTYGDAGIDASAKSSSGLKANYQSSNTAVATVDVNGQVSLIGAGTATITADEAGNANYAAAAPVSFQVQVDQKALTVSANDFNKIYDGIAYTGGNGVSYNGFANGEDANVLRGMLSYGGNSQGASDVGNYAITPGGLSSANYNISYVDGKLLISQTTTNTLAFNTQTAGGLVIKTYGDARIDASAKSSSGLNATYQSSNTNVATVDVNGQVSLIGTGTATITAGDVGNANYAAAAPVSFQVRVDQKALTVTANDFNKTYDGIAYTDGNGISYDGFVNGENSHNLQGTLTYGGSAMGAKDAGSYLIEATGYSANNYAITYRAGKLIISKANLTITANAKVKTYGEADPQFNYSSIGLLGSDAISGTLVRTLGENTGNYAIEAGNLTAGENYNIIYRSAPLSIEKAMLTATSDNIQICENTHLPAFTVSYSGFKLNDKQDVIKTKASVSTLANSSSPAGTYVLTPKDAEADNYSFIYLPGELKINPLPNVTLNASKLKISKGESIILTAKGGEKYNWSGTDGFTSTSTTQMLEVRPLKTTTYTVMAVNALGCAKSVSLTVEVVDDYATLSATNLITPNGDGHNDVWKVENIDAYPDNQVTIFDRAGRIVYTKRNYDNSWAGTSNGNLLAEATYYYVIDFGKGKLKQKGFMTLVRNHPGK
ncbi:hypothetical protein CA265_12220 [Sphingobacteriaceae bacterium GW460-11-11-14-LB5]|nr:hypothetical protein CA265_12220 [Sphingobacteriaceae bacterium GW460-11-11-14-LB5]